VIVINNYYRKRDSSVQKGFKHPTLPYRGFN